MTFFSKMVFLVTLELENVLFKVVEIAGVFLLEFLIIVFKHFKFDLCIYICFQLWLQFNFFVLQGIYMFVEGWFLLYHLNYLFFISFNIRQIIFKLGHQRVVFVLEIWYFLFVVSLYLLIFFLKLCYFIFQNKYCFLDLLWAVLSVVGVLLHHLLFNLWDPQWLSLLLG